MRENEIFVFGSNEAGRHGKGAAWDAHVYFGAVFGIGEGIQGHSYGIPTKDSKIKTLPLEKVKEYVDNFLKFATQRQDLTFYVTQIGCGLAGFTKEQIAPLFSNAPKNCTFDWEWFSFLGKEYDYFQGNLTSDAIIAHSFKNPLTNT